MATPHEVNRRKFLIGSFLAGFGIAAGVVAGCRESNNKSEYSCSVIESPEEYIENLKTRIRQEANQDDSPITNYTVEAGIGNWKLNDGVRSMDSSNGFFGFVNSPNTQQSYFFMIDQCGNLIQIVHLSKKEGSEELVPELRLVNTGISYVEQTVNLEGKWFEVEADQDLSDSPEMIAIYSIRGCINELSEN